VDESDHPKLRSARAAVHRDERGALTVVDAAEVPFTPGRTYVLHDLPVGARRGSHASRSQRRLLVWITGAGRVLATDGETLDRSLECGAGDTLLVAPGVWHEIEVTQPGTHILVLAEGKYDRDDYVASRDALPVMLPSASQTEPA
jgi:oxalate decarboxylase/phosphoglucose isomerase-like protein (cupin superfamily)